MLQTLFAKPGSASDSDIPKVKNTPEVVFCWVYPLDTLNNIHSGADQSAFGK